MPTKNKNCQVSFGLNDAAFNLENLMRFFAPVVNTLQDHSLVQVNNIEVEVKMTSSNHILTTKSNNNE